jgi:hypothetical protein
MSVEIPLDDLQHAAHLAYEQYLMAQKRKQRPHLYLGV